MQNQSSPGALVEQLILQQESQQPETQPQSIVESQVIAPIQELIESKVPETPKVETPQEPTTEPTTAQPATETAQPKEDFFQLLGSEQQNQTTTDQPEVVDYKEKYEQINQLIADPEVQKLLEIKKAGKSFIEFAKEYSPIDYKSKSGEELIKLHGENNNWTPEEIESEIEVFNNKSRFEKESLINGLASHFEREQQGKFEQLIATHKKSAEQEQATLNQSYERIDRLAKSLPGRDLFGVMKLSSNDEKDFREFVTNVPMENEDGTLNEQFLLGAWLGNKLMPKIHKSLLATGKTLGAKEVLQEVQRPNMNASGQSQVPQIEKQAPTPQQARAELLNEWQKRG